MKHKHLFWSLYLIIAMTFFGCMDEPEVIEPAPDAAESENMSLDKTNPKFSAVFTQTNSPSGNEILMYCRSGNGTLNFNGAYSTGGKGTGMGLGSQGAVILHENYLFAVNAGNNEISVFKVSTSGLNLIDKKSSRGIMPISLTVHNNLLYVLNAGGEGNIAGFKVNNSGKLYFLSGSIRPLSSSASQPAQIQFTPDGHKIIVTEKATNKILNYRVRENGRTDGPRIHGSSGMTPFGFEFDKRGHLIVSEAFGGAAGAGAMSSYDIYKGLKIISGTKRNHQTAPCWVVITKNGKFTYTSNTGTHNISGYYIEHDGEIKLFSDGGVTASTGPGSAPIDMSLSHNSKYLYSLNAGNSTISVFSIDNSNGKLSSVQTVSGIPAGSVGLAAD